MSRFLSFVVALFLPMAVLYHACAHGQSASQPPPGSQVQDSLEKPPEGITRAQADAILAELRTIHQLLVMQDRQLAALRSATGRLSASETSAKVTLSLAGAKQWYSLGADDAPVTLVEFGDFQCPFCKKFHTAVYADLKKNYIDTGKIRFVSRDLPLDFHPFAMKAAEAARCAGDQGKYWELRDALYSKEVPPSDDVIAKAVESLSLDSKSFQSCLDSHRYKADVQKDASDAAALQISGTPTFVLARSAKDKLDGVRILGAQPFSSFQTIIDGLLKTPPSGATGGKDD